MTQKNSQKSFWNRPEGITGGLFLLGGVGLATWLVSKSIIAISAFLLTGPGIALALGVLGVVILTALDSRARTLVSYLYQSTMRWITGLFIEINPMAILKAYVSDLRSNLKKMRKQIHQLRSQMHLLNEMIFNNNKSIKSNIELANAAKNSNQQAQLILKSRKAGRLRDSNLKLEDLYKRMQVLYRVLNKMQENSAILVEDIEDQIEMKEQERKAIHASHSAMKSAMSIIKGDSDKRAMFDQALEAIADDVSDKVGEMERFMDMSEDFMQSIDLQNGIYEEKGMELLEKWEKQSTSLLLGDAKEELLDSSKDDAVLDLNVPRPEAVKQSRTNQYDSFFD